MTIKIPDGSVVIHQKLNLSDKLKMYKLFIQVHCLLHNMYIPVSELGLLTYYASYGVTEEAEDLFQKEYKKNNQMLANTRYKLSKLGLIFRQQGYNDWYLPSFLTEPLPVNVSLVLNISRDQ